MVRRYNNNPSIFSRTRRTRPQRQYATTAGAPAYGQPAYDQPSVLSRTHRRRGLGLGLGGRRRAAAPAVVEQQQAPVMTSGALPVRQRRAPLFGRRRRQPVVVEEPVVQRRRTSVSDKIAGALMRLQGTLTRRPGLKVRLNSLWSRSLANG
jgi:hypothetical protein